MVACPDAHKYGNKWQVREVSGDTSHPLFSYSRLSMIKNVVCKSTCFVCMCMFVLVIRSSIIMGTRGFTVSHSVSCSAGEWWEWGCWWRGGSRDCRGDWGVVGGDCCRGLKCAVVWGGEER